MKTFGWLSFPAVFAALSVSGCIIVTDGDFDPRGFDVALSGSISLDFQDGAGTVTANSSSCSTAGFSTIDVMVYDKPTGGNGYLIYSFACANGGFTTTPVLSYDVYYIGLRARDSLGRVVAETSRGFIDASITTTAIVNGTLVVGTLPPPNFDPFGPDVTLEGSWAINFQDGAGDRPANSINCAAAGIDTVQLQIYDDIDGYFVAPASLKFPCSQATFVAPNLLEYGYYYYRWAAIDPNGGEIASSDYVVLDVTTLSSIDTVKAVFNVGFAQVNSLDVNLYWDGTPGPGAYSPADCATAKVDRGMFYLLTDPWGTELASSDLALCANSLSFTNLTYGEYALYVEGYDLNNITRWAGTCVFFVDASGGGIAGCDVPDDTF